MRQALPNPSVPADLLGFRRAVARPHEVRQPKKHLGIDERVVIFRLARDRKTPVELIAAAFQCSVGTVCRIANLAVSEVADMAEAVQPIKPTGDAGAAR